ncbi:transmembrane protein, putative [Rhizoctonia solani AG-3 Rhs1AP]|uniref:Transmembrane protein, putative n=2 Tax=Rhizoctonia solani AG-3 TaxID=1086053 RepID=X8JAK1_9AGAM|nr:transmembrane protein, putative [Rhizoctonia solani AG-3 Rhs1AP]KEP48897.1 putative transmembrane protein [Rhizoctonia solani 123E]
MSLASALLDLLLEAFNNVEVAKNVALASTTFFVYDMLITLGPEVRYVWSAKWGYGRVAFHFNRIWSILVLGIYLPMIFGYDVPIPRLVFTFGSNDLYSSFDTRCRQVILFYGYGVVLLIFNTSIVMSLRAWILYDRNQRSGLFYYVFNCASLLISIGLGMNSKINNVAVGSG